MLEPSLYPRTPASVELRDTHISWVFLAGERAYKVKKPVVFPFLDYGTLARRRRMCHEEVRLNRRLAPRIYLGVVGISRSGDRYSLTVEEDPQAIEYAVEMRRVEEDRSLDALVGRGELDAAHLAAVAARLARFHAAAPAAPPMRLGLEVLVDTMEENLATLREAGDGILDPGRLDAAERFTRGVLASRGAELASRAQAGRVRDCHGDLRAEHVIVPSGGDLYVYDCVEFNPALRQIDVAADLAFLVMDLARLGAEGSALQLVEDYRGSGGDPGDEWLIAFFAAYRAWVRAKVACLRALELGGDDPERAGPEAQACGLLDLGHRFAWRARRPMLLVVSGVAASGKTTLARRLAELSGWQHISSDLTRKRLAGLEPTERGSERHYSPELTARTYAEMGGAARAELARHGGAIVDATFHRRAERAAFSERLGDPPGPILVVHCTAPVELLLERVRARKGDRDRVSDAGVEVVRGQLEALDPVDQGWRWSRSSTGGRRHPITIRPEPDGQGVSSTSIGTCPPPAGGDSSSSALPIEARWGARYLPAIFPGGHQSGSGAATEASPRPPAISARR
jgi:aminoglycoside phosphotransferase family enzyme/predicted kinase